MSLGLLTRASRVRRGHHDVVAIAIVSLGRQRQQRRLYSHTPPPPPRSPTPSTQPRRATSSAPPPRPPLRPPPPANTTKKLAVSVSPAPKPAAPVPAKTPKKAVVAFAPRNAPTTKVVPSPAGGPTTALVRPVAADVFSLNPPVTTRPAELLSPPERVEGQSKVSHLMSKGKGILTFYKTGIKHVMLNTKLVWGRSVMPPPPPTMPRVRLPWDKDPRSPEEITEKDKSKGQRVRLPWDKDPRSPEEGTEKDKARGQQLKQQQHHQHHQHKQQNHQNKQQPTGKMEKKKSSAKPASDQTDPSQLIHPPRPGTRAYLQLHRRWRHDIVRLPVFIVILILWGEMTPLALILFPSLSPTVCRMPVQIDRTLKRAEDRRAKALRTLAHEGKSPLAPWASPTHALKALNLNHRWWDIIDGMAADYQAGRLRRYLRYLARDGAFIVDAGGPAALEKGELYIACAERGIDVRMRKAADLQPVLARWLKLTTQGAESAEETMWRIKIVTGWREQDWPDEWPGWRLGDVEEDG